MPQSISKQPDGFEELLAEALRAGPGSPQWQEAVHTLRLEGDGDIAGAAGPEGKAYEYRLLMAARERLEGGKDYRSVRAGPVFTQEVMQKVDQLAARGSAGRGMMKWIITLGLVLMVLAIGVSIWQNSSKENAANAQVASLSRLYFVQERVSTDFARGNGDQWKLIGNLPMKNYPWAGLRPDAVAVKQALTEQQKGYLSGGVVTAQPIPADAPVKVEIRIRPGKLGDSFLPQVFVSDQPTFSQDQATSAHELAWLAKQDGEVMIALPDGEFAGKGTTIKPGRDPVTITLRMNGSVVIVECDGRMIHAGPILLGKDKPRYIGVRFVVNAATAADKVEDLPSLLSVKIWNGQ